ncbi:MFS transporter [Streptomyces sp. DSM 41527]|uniref:MFS transporter n=1 Tax=Streptomyces mooreae TaxID=3075523 RepID=A0ABU2SYS3_9ACTN|nr:MFS transporter [Streptomyces sp. DSM 41527]MDT0454149.1 MFS transporter [Streptomyces sp. DSM 41527]
MTTVPTTAPPNSTPLSSRSLRLLRSAGFVSNFDRFCITPMLVLIAAQLGAGMATVVLTASVYFLCYGLMQPVWGLASDRLGRVRVMRLSLTAGAVSALLSALAPDLTFLIMARALAGACFAACVPASLSYVGDVVPAEVRQRPLSDLMTAFSLGTALGTVVAGALAHYAGWRTVFLLPGLVAAYLAHALRHLAEPEREPAGSLLAPFRIVLRSRWMWFVMALALTEGAVLLGFLTYLAPALETRGVPTAVAGAVSALYGAGAMGFAQVVKRLVGRWSPAVLLLVGGAAAAAAYAAAATSRSLPALAVTALLLGGSWSFMHTTLQSWAIAVAPAARATGVAMFGVSLYGGSALASSLTATTAANHDYGQLFLIAMLLTVPLTLAAVVGRGRYR